MLYNHDGCYKIKGPGAFCGGPVGEEGQKTNTE